MDNDLESLVAALAATNAQLQHVTNSNAVAMLCIKDTIAEVKAHRDSLNAVLGYLYEIDKVLTALEPTAK